MTDKQFKTKVYELVFGTNAIYKGHTNAEVARNLKAITEDALRYELLCGIEGVEEISIGKAN